MSTLGPRLNAYRACDYQRIRERQRLPGALRQIVPSGFGQLHVLEPHVLRYRCDGPLPAKRRNEFVTQRTLKRHPFRHGQGA